MRTLIPGQCYNFSPPYGSAEILIWSLTYQPRGEETQRTEWRFVTCQREDPRELITERATTWSQMISILKSCYPGETEDTLEPRITVAPTSVGAAI